MFEKYLSLVLAASLAYVANAAPAFAQSAAGKEALLAARVKEGVLSLGVGPEAFVRLRLHDKTRMGGYIDEAGADSFTITDELTGKAATVSYSQVRQIAGANSLTRASIAIGLGRWSRLAVRECWTRRKPPATQQ
jgi:hypothetical protein